MTTYIHSNSKKTLPLISSQSSVIVKQNKKNRALKEIQLPEDCSSPFSREAITKPVTKKGKLIVIEGNIGVGKSTLATNLSAELSYKVFVEPALDNPYLEKFYKEPKKFALPLQLWILQQRYQTYLQAAKYLITTGNGVILDRSVYSDIVFANVCHKEGYINEVGYQKYMLWRRRALECLPHPHVMLFLNAPPECCYQRIQSRGRQCEGGVPIDYLRKLHSEYEMFCGSMKKFGSLLLNQDWTCFRATTEVASDLCRQHFDDWDAQVVKDFCELHWNRVELIPASELQDACTI